LRAINYVFLELDAEVARQVGRIEFVRAAHISEELLVRVINRAYELGLRLDSLLK